MNRQSNARLSSWRTRKLEPAPFGTTRQLILWTQHGSAVLNGSNLFRRPRYTRVQILLRFDEALPELAGGIINTVRSTSTITALRSSPRRRRWRHSIEMAPTELIMNWLSLRGSTTTHQQKATSRSQERQPSRPRRACCSRATAPLTPGSCGLLTVGFYE